MKHVGRNTPQKSRWVEFDVQEDVGEREVGRHSGSESGNEIDKVSDAALFLAEQGVYIV